MGVEFTEKSAERIAAVVLKVEKEIRDETGGPRRAPRFVGDEDSDPGFWVRVASSEAVDGQPNHFTYTGYRQIPYTPGLWQDDPDNTDAVTPIYNAMEANNSDTGVQGNGTDLGDYPDGTTIPPLRGNPVLWCRPGVDCYGNPEYWVSAPNAAPVVCGGS